MKAQSKESGIHFFVAHVSQRKGDTFLTTETSQLLIISKVNLMEFADISWVDVIAAQTMKLFVTCAHTYTIIHFHLFSFQTLATEGSVASSYDISAPPSASYASNGSPAYLRNNALKMSGLFFAKLNARKKKAPVTIAMICPNSPNATRNKI